MEKKKTIVVTLESKEIKFDVMNKSHLTGQARNAEGKDYRATAYMQASEDDEHAYQLLRSISNAFSHLKVELGEYLHEDGSTSNNRINKTVEDGGKLTLSFLLPSNFNNSACDSLGGMLHEYIVDRTLSEWFVITDKQDAQDYANLATDALNQAKQALYKRERPTRPTYTD
ncbi:hypothetical protein [uncultured Muribaculum sp.]|uniref:hypothetical protein n=1 Tax=uncultured Muribaculum sp. TaxID=1918613 RepID=UPI00259D0264|nr:hypothetical protein [uncultured Muribaculum sp.]